jgi:hypothetical protein
MLIFHYHNFYLNYLVSNTKSSSVYLSIFLSNNWQINFFLFLLLNLSSHAITFLLEGVIVEFRNFAWGLCNKINKILGKNDPTPPPLRGANFQGFFREKRKVKWNEMGRKLIGKFPLVSMGAWVEGLACAGLGARAPNTPTQKKLFRPTPQHHKRNFSGTSRQKWKTNSILI